MRVISIRSRARKPCLRNNFDSELEQLLGLAYPYRFQSLRPSSRVESPP